MPCYDHRDDPSYIRAELQEDTRRKVEEARVSFLHNSPVAELLCFVMTNTPPSKRGPLLIANSKLACWWRDHQVRDRKVANEKADKERKRVASVKAQIKKLEDSLKS